MKNDCEVQSVGKKLVNPSEKLRRAALHALSGPSAQGF